MYEAHLAALGLRLPNDARPLWTEVSLHDEPPIHRTMTRETSWPV